MKYFVEIGGKRFDADSRDKIFALVKKNFGEDVDKNLLERMIKEKKSIFDHAKSFFSREKHRKGSVDFNEAVHGATALLKNSAGLTVTQEEINRRTIICSSCPKISMVSNCFSCGFAGILQKWVNNFKKILRRDIQYPNGIEKKYCDHCECSLAVMLPSRIQNFSSSEKGISTKRPKNCWLNPDSENFTL